MDERYRLVTEKEQILYKHPEIPIIAGTYNGLCRIFGGGSTMWQDYENSERLFPGTDKLAVNIASLFIPHPLQHMFSWHHKQISYIKGWRQAEIPDDRSLVHSVKDFERINHVWHFDGGTSVSGLSALDLVYLLGYRKIVLCGIPMDGNSYFYKPSINRDMNDKYRHEEVRRLKHIYGDIVKSFSGYTKEIFGEPSTEWGDK